RGPWPSKGPPVVKNRKERRRHGGPPGCTHRPRSVVRWDGSGTGQTPCPGGSFALSSVGFLRTAVKDISAEKPGEKARTRPTRNDRPGAGPPSAPATRERAMSSAANRANQQMVDRLIAQGTLWSPPLIAAFRATPRHRFLDRVFQYVRKHGRWREVL